MACQAEGLALGHIRLGVLSQTRRWQQVVEILADSESSVGAVTDSALNAADGIGLWVAMNLIEFRNKNSLHRRIIVSFENDLRVHDNVIADWKRTGQRDLYSELGIAKYAVPIPTEGSHPALGNRASFRERTGPAGDHGPNVPDDRAVRL